MTSEESPVESPVETPVETVSNPIEEVTKKDPKRVEAGKRLAAISKAAKEKKMRQKIEAEYEMRESNNILGTITPLRLKMALGIGMTVYLGYRWFWKKEEKFEHKKIVREMEEDKVEKKPKQKKFETLG